MKLNRKHKVVIGVIVLLYAITWYFGSSAVHESIDIAESRYGNLSTTSVPILPCVLFCSSNNMEELGGRHAVGLYLWYGVGILRVFELPTIVA